MSKFALAFALALALPAFAGPADQKGGKDNFKIFKGDDGQSYFNLKAANNEIVLQSEGYANHGGAEKGVNAARKAACDAPSYKFSRSIAGQYYFVLRADNHEVVGMSQMYKTKAAAQKGQAAVMSAAGCKAG